MTTTMMREPECVALKRRGAEHVASLISGMSVQEQLAYWRKRTEAMVQRQQQAQKQSSGR